MKMYDTPQSVEKYLDRELACSCGRTHYVPIKAVEVRPGAIEAVPELTEKLGYQKPYILCDQITYKIAGAKAENGKLLTNGGRVLGAVETADTLASAVEKAYGLVSRISFGNAYYRHDIGARALKAGE